jgi:phospholipase/carboxylesterase
MTHSDTCIEICTAASPTAAVIWLHGLGADGNDFVPIVPDLHLPDSLKIRFLFPHAPVRPVSCNGGYEMRAWYDIYSLDDLGQEDAAGMRDSQQRLEALIQTENDRGIPSHRIVLMGFSQGGAIALYTGLRHRQRLAGIGALSAYLPLRNTPENHYSQTNKNTPIFMAHGSQDTVVRYEYGTTTHELLKNMGYSISWKSYAMDHSVCDDEIADIAGWLVSCLQADVK